MALDALFDGLSDPVELTRFDPFAPLEVEANTSNLK
jgi:hypothetical protein